MCFALSPLPCCLFLTCVLCASLFFHLEVSLSSCSCLLCMSFSLRLSFCSHLHCASFCRFKYFIFFQHVILLFIILPIPISVVYEFKKICALYKLPITPEYNDVQTNCNYIQNEDIAFNGDTLFFIIIFLFWIWCLQRIIKMDGNMSIIVYLFCPNTQ